MIAREDFRNVCIVYKLVLGGDVPHLDSVLYRIERGIGYKGQKKPIIPVHESRMCGERICWVCYSRRVCDIRAIELLRLRGERICWLDSYIDELNLFIGRSCSCVIRIWIGI